MGSVQKVFLKINLCAAFFYLAILALFILNLALTFHRYDEMRMVRQHKHTRPEDMTYEREEAKYGYYISSYNVNNLDKARLAYLLARDSK